MSHKACSRSWDSFPWRKPTVPGWLSVYREGYDVSDEYFTLWTNEERVPRILDVPRLEDDLVNGRCAVMARRELFISPFSPKVPSSAFLGRAYLPAGDWIHLHLSSRHVPQIAILHGEARIQRTSRMPSSGEVWVLRSIGQEMLSVDISLTSLARGAQSDIVSWHMLSDAEIVDIAERELRNDR